MSNLLICLYFDFAVRRSPQEIARRLMVILNQVTSEEMQNQVRYI
ncbi:hypothetical protein [Pseudanabaena minima]